MNKIRWKSPACIAIIAVAAALVAALAVVLVICLQPQTGTDIVQLPAEDEYVYVNPDETKAETDAGMVIDGVLDESVYEEKNWLYLSNDENGNNVNIAMTTHFGEKGMYFAFDVTESVPIYVNPNRSPVLNSCIELYIVPPHLKGINGNSVLEIDLLPTGDIAFRKSNGKYGYTDVETSKDIMAYLGAETKGGEVNTLECYGYVLELFIPWDYIEWLEMDVDAMKNGYVLVNPAHITSFNETGTNVDIDRYWYHFAQKIGTDFANVSQYFRFNGDGVMGTFEVALEEGEHYSFAGANVALPGMQIPITIIPEEGYALTSIKVDGQERIQKVSYNEDGSVTVLVRVSGNDHKVSAKAEAVTEGKKTLSGKIRLNGVKNALISYVGPLGEKPITIDASGNFVLKDLEPGYYVLKVEAEGYPATTQGIYLNRDIYTELTLKIPVFSTVYGNSWILDDESEGVLYKINGRGEIISNASYKDFTFETYVKYDPELAKLSNDDFYLQQRSGIRILFSNEKCWHIDVMWENGRYIVQYAKMSGENSLFSWKNVHTLTEEQIKQYTSKDGIKLTVKRVGNQAALCLGDEVLFIEELAEEYKKYTAQLGFEAWIANSELMKIPYSITPSAKLPEAPKVYFYSAETWDVTEQQNGVIYKTGVAGVTTWLDSAIIANDITTIAKDLDPAANDYSMIYIFKFSNGEQFRVRLNHTDNDGRYRIQSMAGSTLFDAWKNHYTLSDEQALLVQGEGIAFRVWIDGTTAYVYLDGQQVCTYDLSTVVATGLPSGIEKATVNVSLRVDGVIGQKVAIPFVLTQTAAPVEPEKPVEPEVPVDPEKKITLNIGSFANGTVKPVKSAYGVGDTVELTITPAAGYTQKLYINGEPLMLDWKTNTYSFVATQKEYEITGSFEKSLTTKPLDVSRWDWSNQAHGILNTYYPYENDSWYMDIQGDYQSISVLAKNYMSMVETAETANNTTPFQIVLRVTMDNGKIYSFRIFNKMKDDGTPRYEYNRFGAGGSVTGWGGWKDLTAYNDIISGEGALFKLERTGGNTLTISINDVVLDTYTMDGVTADNKVVSMGMSHQGNRGLQIQMPFVLTVPAEEPPVVEPPVVEPPVIENPVEIKIPDLANGTVTLGKAAYAVG